MKRSMSLFFLWMVVLSCKKESPPSYNFEFDIKPVEENDVTIEWKDMEAGNTHKFTVATDDQFSDPVATAEAVASEGTTTLTGLSPLTRYYLKIEVKEGQEFRI